MLRPEQIEAIQDQLTLLTDPINSFLIKDITARIIQAGQITATSQYEAQLARSLGAEKRELEKITNKQRGEVRKIFELVAKLIWGQDTALMGQYSAKAVPFEQNEWLQTILSAAIDLAEDTFTNITGTLGMVDPYGNALPLQIVYRSASDYAFSKFVTGAQNPHEAVKEAVKNIAQYGVQVIDYESGHRDSIDVAVRRNLYSAMGLMINDIETKAHDELGCDGWEISAHMASAPDHEPYQGRQFTNEEYETLQTVTLKRPIGTWNCKHIAFPIFIGINKPQYSEKELQDMARKNEKGITFEGKKYTAYEATQQQRAIERSIRRQKQKIEAYSQSPIFSSELKTAKARYNVLLERYKQFSSAADMPMQEKRLELLT